MSSSSLGATSKQLVLHTLWNSPLQCLTKATTPATTPATTKNPLKSPNTTPDSKKKVWLKLKSGLYGWKLETGQHVAKLTSAKKPQKHNRAVTPLKSAKLAANIFNLKKMAGHSQWWGQLVVGGERLYDYVRTVIQILSKKIFNNYQKVHKFQSENQSLQSWRKWGRMGSRNFEVDFSVTARQQIKISCCVYVLSITSL